MNQRKRRRKFFVLLFSSSPLLQITINSGPDPLVTWIVPVFTGRATDRRWSDTYRISLFFPWEETKKERCNDAERMPRYRAKERILLCRARDRCSVRAALPRTLRSTAKKRASGKRRSAEKDKRNSTYLAYFSAYVLPELIETSRQGHLVTTSHSILARQFVHRVPDVIALQQIPNSIIRIGVLFLSLSFSRHHRDR